MEDTPSDSVSEEKADPLTDELRPPPFPFSLESTWFLATAWVLLGVTNGYVQLGLESYLGLGAILLKTLATAICAVVATFFYDGALTLVNEYRIWVNRDVELRLASLVARHWRIEINEDTTLEDQKAALMQDGTLQVPRTVFSATSELATLAVNCALLLAYHVLAYYISFWHLLSGLTWVLRTYLGLPHVLINASVLVGLPICGPWVADTSLGRLLRLWDIYDRIQLGIVICFRAPLALLKVYPSPDIIQQLVWLTISGMLTVMSWALPTSILVPLADQGVDKLVRCVDATHRNSNALFSPESDRSWSSAGQLGAQVGLQLCLAALCFLAVLTFHYLCQEQLIVKQGELERGEIELRDIADDERCLAAYWRAIALHLISFTAYQIFEALVSAFELRPLLHLRAPPALSSWRALRSLRHDLALTAFRVGLRGLVSLGTALCIYAIHYILRQGAWLLIRIMASMVAFGDAVLWYSRLTQDTVVSLRDHVLFMARQDFKVKDKVLLAEGLMNALFDIKAPLVIVPPNFAIKAFDPEVWAGQLL
ncbi:hypothetical protein PG985_006211 [Apiospora marii]|uniref:ABC transmembrane type-1 domain-containing protein n=1 Tax=Apiospora marii TaxID=335849 RepID=A0ABR1S8A8_9PEZI